MENIDDLMRQKYDNDAPADRFQFREEYWEQALALIEADEAKRRKRKRWIFWWMFTGGLLLCMGIGWWQFGGHNAAAKTADGTNAPSTTAIGPAAAKDSPLQLTQPSTAGMANKGESPATDKPFDTKNIVSNTNQKSSKGIENQLDKHALAAPTAKGSRKGATGSDNTAGIENQLDKHALAAPMAKRSQKGATGSDNNIAVDNLSATAPSGMSPGQNANGAARTAAQSTDGAVVPVVGGNGSVPVAVSGAATPGEAMSASADTLKKLLEQLLPLPLPMRPVNTKTFSPLQKPQYQAAPMANQITPHHDQRLSCGFWASAMAHQASFDKRQLGFNTGLYGAYRFNTKWSASVGAGLRLQSGSWADSTGIDIKRKLQYSFGFEEIVSERSAVGLLSLEIPVAAQWHYRALAVEGGIAPGFLLYALDRFKQTRETSLEGTKTLQNRIERGDTTRIGKKYANVFVGGAWNFSKNAALTLRGNYRFGNVVLGDAEHAAIKGGASIDVGLRFRLY